MISFTTFTNVSSDAFARAFALAFAACKSSASASWDLDKCLYTVKGWACHRRRALGYSIVILVVTLRDLLSLFKVVDWEKTNNGIPCLLCSRSGKFIILHTKAKDNKRLVKGWLVRSGGG
ncbi:hypothetical protein NC651_021970 [Populus alba x Populus x berolinensis]|nr:hypothetical protein NC651_021970 [Populus alba x Populus x berolinensis]